MIEDQLRDTFARHEPEAPGIDALRRGIARLTTRRRHRRVAVRTGGVAAAVAIVLLAIPLVVRDVPPGHVPIIAPGSATSLPDRALNILVLGLDPYPPSQGPNPGADSVTIAHISADRTHVYLVDFERDVRVDIPGHGQGKLTSAYAFGGARLTVEIVQSMTGVSLDGVVVVTIDALRDMVNAVGGIDQCVPFTVKSIHTGRTFPTGCYHLDGAGVADLVRQRTDLPEGAYSRDMMIQDVMMSLVNRVHALNLLTDANRITALLSARGLQIDLHGISAIALAAQLNNLRGGDLVGIVSPHFQSLPPDNGVAYQQLDPVVTPDLFAALRTDTLDTFATAHPDWINGH